MVLEGLGQVNLKAFSWYWDIVYFRSPDSRELTIRLSEAPFKETAWLDRLWSSRM